MNRKLAFKGLKGFTERSNPIELAPITILTGKNSSGKSSFLKLKRLIFGQLKNVKRMGDLFDIEINIGDEEAGGRENLISSISNNDYRVIFQIIPEFYRGYFEVHLILKVEDYLIKIEKVEVYDSKDGKNRKPILFYSYSYIFLNLEILHEKYKKDVLVYNDCEKYRMMISEVSQSDPRYYKVVKTFEKYLLQREEQLVEALKDHSHHGISYFEAFASKIQFYDEQVPFGSKFLDNAGFFNQIYDGRFNLIPTNKELEQFVNGYHQKEELFEEIGNLGGGTTINNTVKWLRKFLLKNNKKIAIGIDDHSIQHGFMSLVLAETSEFPFMTTYGSGLEPDLLYNDLVELAAPAIHLAKGSAKLFDSAIIASLNFFENSATVSSVRFIPSRTHDLLTGHSNLIDFLKRWKSWDEEERAFRLAFIKKYIKEFEIADNITIDVDRHIGKVFLLKGKHKFELIDEGSGISRLVNTLFFLASEMEKVKESGFEPFQDSVKINVKGTQYHFSKENWRSQFYKYLILEEPESNLHPYLQSKLADLLIDFQKMTGITMIIETHSEYLIRKLQYLVGKGEFENDGIVINYFSLERFARKPYIQNWPIRIDKSGTLNGEFGPGFMDEANGLAIDLFLLNEHQRN